MADNQDDGNATNEKVSPQPPARHNSDSVVPQVSFGPPVIHRGSIGTERRNTTDSSSESYTDEYPSSILQEKDDYRHHDSFGREELIQATLDQANVNERHGEFADHVNESAAMVQRMLGHHDEPADNTTIIEEDDNGESKELSVPNAPMRSGSVFGALMSMENQRQRRHHHHHRKSKAANDAAAKNRRMYHLPHISKSEEALPSTKASMPVPSMTPVVPTEKKSKHHRPKNQHRNSWIAGVTHNRHIVPSLEKRKAISAASSRRSSMDSMTTGSTQNAHISLEDRVRVTFEIANILQKQALVQKLAKCLMQYGCPGHRIEYIMRTVSRTLQLDCEFVYVPNVMLTSFIDSTMHTTETRFIIQPQFFEMARLFEVYRLEKLLSHGEVTVDEALEFLDRVVVHDTVYPAWLNLFVYALASFCGCAMFYGGNWKEAGVSSALAVFFAIYELFSGRVVSLQPIYEITCCIIIGFISRGLELAGFCFVPMAFASFIIILPGYSMTLGISELVSRQLVSGVVRMVYAIMYSFLIGYGISMGSSLFELIDPADVSEFEHYCNTRNKNSNTCVTVVPQMFYLLTVPLFAVAYCVFLRARPARWPFMITLGITGFVINWALSCHASAPTQVIQVVPAFVVGFLGNLYTKITGKMSFDAVLLGVFYLVPGSLGLKAALGLFGGSAGSEFSNQGGGFALSMIETSIGISVGLFVATLLVYPKGSQHTPLMNF